MSVVRNDRGGKTVSLAVLGLRENAKIIWDFDVVETRGI